VELKQLLNDGGELDRKELVCLVHDEHGALAQVGDSLSSQVENSAGCSDNNVHWVLETDNVVPKTCSTCSNHYVNAEMFSEGFADLGCLHSEFSSGDEDEALDLRYFGVDTLEGGNDECGGLARAILCAGKNISASESDGDALFLDRGGLFVTGFEYTHQQITVKLEVFEFQSFRIRDILCAWSS